MTRSLLALATCLSLACAGAIRDYPCEPAAGRLDREAADAIWRCNRGVVARVVEGKKFGLREFWMAREFFERLTGIPADVDRSAVGTIPGRDLARSLRAWDDWYHANGERLYWDPDERAVRVSVGGDP